MLFRSFPVMAWPMVEWVLDTHYVHCFDRTARLEKSVIVIGAMEATLTPLMEAIEAMMIALGPGKVSTLA